MRIALVSFEIGVLEGYENVRSAHIQLLYSLANGLFESGVEVTIITNKLRKGTFIPGDLNKNINIHFILDPRKRNSTNVMHSGFSKKIDVFGVINSILSTRHYLAKGCFDAVHYVNGGIDLGLYAAVVNLLSMGTYKTYWSTSVSKLKASFIQHILLKRLNGIVFATDYQAKIFSRVFSNIFVIKHGVSRIFSISSGSKNRITFWRDPSYENGADIAYQVFSMLAPLYPHIIFTIMVRPYFDSVIPDEQSVVNIPNIEIYSYPYPSSISLENILDQTLFCFFPFRELSTNPQLCVLESVSAGIPCLVTRVESLPEYVLDSNYLLDSNSVNNCAAQIHAILGNHNSLPKPSSPLRNGFSWDSFINLHLNLYSPNRFR